MSPPPDASSAAEDLEVTAGRAATVGRFDVRRALPRRGRRTVGAWCFCDLMGPAGVTEQSGLDIGPHPHIGLQTVTWLLEGEALHRDSLGSEQVIRPGQLNLMTAGHGVSHSEEATGRYRGPLEGAQLWVAQPASTRDGPAAFEHHGQLPAVATGAGMVTVLIGELAGEISPARHDTPLVGADLDLRAGITTLELNPRWEYAVVVARGSVEIGPAVIPAGSLAYLGLGGDGLALRTAGAARLLLLGGEPFAEEIVMWWNFVARTRDEVAGARRDWEAGAERFGRFDSPLARIPAPAVPDVLGRR